MVLLETLEVQMILLHPDVMWPPGLHDLDVLVRFDLSLNKVEVGWGNGSDLLEVLESYLAEVDDFLLVSLLSETDHSLVDVVEEQRNCIYSNVEESESHE